jgi:glycosyltransferase involved in cell wall biosynthesis
MKIGMLTDVYRPVINGVTHFIALVKREMEIRGHEVTVFTFGNRDTPPDEPRVVISPAVPIADTGYHLSLAYSREARLMIGQMDVLHAHHPFISGRLAARYSRMHNVPIVFTNHTRYDLYARSYLPAVPPSLTQLMLESYLPAFAALCDLVIAPSSSIRRVLKELGVEQEIRVIPNGIDLEKFRRPAAGCVRRDDLGIGDDGLVLLYCGRLGPEKNVEFLLQAFEGVREAIPEAYLVLVGGGPTAGNLQRHRSARENVRFVGQVPYDAVAGYLSIADVFVTASVTEVHPLSIIEAIAVGLPVVAVRSPGVEDTVRHQVDGYLSSKNLASYTALLVKILLEPERRHTMAAHALERSQEYDICATVTALLEEYERLIEERKKRPPTETFWQTLTREVQQVLGE